MEKTQETIQKSPKTALAPETATLLQNSILRHSFYRTCVPDNLTDSAKKKQVRERIIAAATVLGSETARSLLTEDLYFCKPFESTEKQGPFKTIYLLLTGHRTPEGDFGISLLVQPKSAEHGLLKVAHIGFMFTGDSITITSLHGATSYHDKSAANRFGRETLLNGDFYGKLQKALNGVKPFNLLIGLLLEICAAKRIPRIRGVEVHRLPFAGKNQIRHRFGSAFMACGLRPSATEGVYEKQLSTPADKEKCFARITGKDPKTAPARREIFSKALSALEQTCPSILEKEPRAISSLTREQINTTANFRPPANAS